MVLSPAMFVQGGRAHKGATYVVSRPEDDDTTYLSLGIVEGCLCMLRRPLECLPRRQTAPEGALRRNTSSRRAKKTQCN
jgi:hypothetical protein